VLVLFALVGLTGCSEAASGDDRPLVVATHSVLGDLVRNVVGEEADVDVVMPAGADPHEFEPSAAQVATMTEADLVVANGLGLEHGLDDALAAAVDAGVPVLDLGDEVDPLTLAHGDELDPHWFTDPSRMAIAAGFVAHDLQVIDGVDADRVEDQAQAYVGRLARLDREVADELAGIPAGARRLVTSHEVLGYFADRYGFDVVGTIIPSGSTLAEPSASDLGELVDEIEALRLPALFVDASAPTGLVDVVADEVGDDVDVVELWSESLGDADSPAATYVDLIRTDAARIAEALAR
jgi:zinc/manganese transport system substrate-binding protein